MHGDVSAKSESRSVVIVLRRQVWNLRENDLSASMLPIGKQREFLEVLSRLGRRCCLRVSLTVRTPRWIRNPTLPDVSSGSSSETVDFQKMTAMASDGPTSYTVLDQVPLSLLQTYLRNKSTELVMCPLFLAEATFEF